MNNLIKKKYVKKRIDGRKAMFSLTKKGKILADKIIRIEKIKKTMFEGF